MLSVFKSVIFLTSLLLTLSACNDSSQLAAGKKSDSTDDEDEKADEPVPVSGAYLTCDWLEQDTGESALIGCAVMTSEGNAFDRTNRDFSLGLYNNDDSKADMKAADASEDSRWHKLARLPASHKNTGYLKMTVKKSDSLEGSYRLNTVDIASNVSLGNHSDGEEPIPLENSEGLALKSITSNLQWDGGLAGLALSKIDAKDFCDNGGKLRTTLSPNSAIAVGIADGLFNSSTTNTNSTISDIAIPLKSTTCFSTFKEMGSSGKEFAHQNADGSCLLLRSGNTIHVISKQKANLPEMTLENLRQFAAKKACIN